MGFNCTTAKFSPALSCCCSILLRSCSLVLQRGFRVLHIAAMLADPGVMEDLLAAGADIDAPDMVSVAVLTGWGWG